MSAPDIVCAVCRRVLDRHLSADGFSWHHPAAAPHDHDPVPVPRAATGGEVVDVCDFCTAPGPAWAYPCADFRVEIPGGGPDYTSEGGWAACRDCHRLIERGDWSALADRSARRYPTPVRKTMRDAVRRIQRGFRDARLGDPHPIFGKD